MAAPAPACNKDRLFMFCSVGLAGEAAPILGSELAVLEPIEIRVQAATGEILARHADEIACERARHGVLVGEDRCILLPCHSRPALAGARVEEANAIVLDLELQEHSFAIIERIFLFDRIADVAALTAHESEAFLGVRGMRQEQVIKTIGAVERDEPRHLLERLGLEFHARGSLDVEARLSSREETLLVVGDDALAAIKSEMTFARGQARYLPIDRDARRLPVNRKRAGVEIVSCRLFGRGMQRQLGRPERVERDLTARC